MSSSALEAVFGPSGLLSKVLSPHYEWREAQARLADEVERTLRQGGVLLAEAPTGVGKSLAYLYPALRLAIADRRPVVISTHTKSLQDQILDKEMPRLRRLFDRELRVQVLKGRSNYLCRNRYAHFQAELAGTTDGERVSRLLDPWVQTTETGDFAEAPLEVGREGWALTRISGETRFCSTRRCTAETGCYYKLSRQKARDAHLLIVNHALLLVDVLGDASGLPEWTAAVIDEAHQLARAAAEPLSFAVSESSLETVLKLQGGRGEPGLTDELRKALRAEPDKEVRTALTASMRELEAETGRLLQQARAFWVELAALPFFPRETERRRYGPNSEHVDPMPPSAVALCVGLRAQLEKTLELVEQVAFRHESLEGRISEPPALLEARRHGDQLTLLVQQFEALVTPDDRQTVYWIETGGSRGPTLRLAPLEVGTTLRRQLFDTRPSLVLTSATLAVSGSFEHAAGKLGLDLGAIDTLLLGSPFQLDEQVRAYTFRGAPDPNAAAFVETLSSGVVLLAKKIRRKMLVLFTSHDMLRRVEAQVRSPLEDTGIRVHAQGIDGSQTALRARFLEEGPAVLLGAATFWEGMDFPGEELEVLVLTRLPFLVPNDPIVEATAERLAAEGRDPFQSYYLPEAILRYRQGFGRLIRRRGDRGVFVVADSRAQEKGYGAAFRRSTGGTYLTAASWDEVAEQALEWFEAP